MDLSARLAACEAGGPSSPSVRIQDIWEPAKIVGAQKVQTQYKRPAIMLEVDLVGGERRVTFLPARFVRTLTDEDLCVLVSEGYSVLCTGTVGRTNNVKIFKA